MEQITISFPPETLAFLKHTAERECRSVGAQIRYYVEAARRTVKPTATLEPWPPPLPTVTPDNLAAMKEQLAEWEAERARLEEFQRRGGLNFMPHHDARLRWLRDTCKTMGKQIEVIGGRGGSHG
jgi:hypothetical protein